MILVPNCICFYKGCFCCKEINICTYIFPMPKNYMKIYISNLVSNYVISNICK